MKEGKWYTAYYSELMYAYEEAASGEAMWVIYKNNVGAWGITQTTNSEEDKAKPPKDMFPVFEAIFTRKWK